MFPYSRFVLILGILFLLSAVSCGGKSARVPTASTGINQELNRCLRLSAKKKYEEAVDCLEVFKSRYPSGSASATADIYIADNFFRQKEFLLAAESYQDFIRNNPFNEKLDYAYYQSGKSYLNQIPKAVDRDQEYIDLALQNFEIVARHFPSSPYYKLAVQEYNKARTTKAHKHYYVGRFYYKYKEYLAALSRFELIVNDFPHVGYDEKSFYYLVNACVKTNQPEKAIKVLEAFEKRYPSSKLVKSARSKILTGP